MQKDISKAFQQYNHLIKTCKDSEKFKMGTLLFFKAINHSEKEKSGVGKVHTKFNLKKAVGAQSSEYMKIICEGLDPNTTANLNKIVQGLREIHTEINILKKIGEALIADATSLENISKFENLKPDFYSDLGLISTNDLKTKYKQDIGNAYSPLYKLTEDISGYQKKIEAIKNYDKSQANNAWESSEINILKNNFNENAKSIKTTIIPGLNKYLVTKAEEANKIYGQTGKAQAEKSKRGNNPIIPAVANAKTKFTAENVNKVIDLYNADHKELNKIVIVDDMKSVLFSNFSDIIGNLKRINKKIPSMLLTIDMITDTDEFEKREEFMSSLFLYLDILLFKIIVKQLQKWEAVEIKTFF